MLLSAGGFVISADGYFFLMAVYQYNKFHFIPFYTRVVGLVKLSVPGRPTYIIIVGQGPIALAIGAGRGCLDIFSLFSFYLSGRRSDIG